MDPVILRCEGPASDELRANGILQTEERGIAGRFLSLARAEIYRGSNDMWHLLLRQDRSRIV